MPINHLSVCLPAPSEVTGYYQCLESSFHTLSNSNPPHTSLKSAVLLTSVLIISLLCLMFVPLLCVSLMMCCPLLTRLGLCLLLHFSEPSKICDLFSTYHLYVHLPSALNSEQTPIRKPGHKNKQSLPIRYPQLSPKELFILGIELIVYK